MTSQQLTKHDRKEIVYLAGCALMGILSDHEHHQKFGDMNCAQSTCEWAARYAFETHLRLRQKFADAKTEPVTFPKHVKAYA